MIFVIVYKGSCESDSKAVMQKTLQSGYLPVN